jgi:hypothetical protein
MIFGRVVVVGADVVEVGGVVTFGRVVVGGVALLLFPPFASCTAAKAATAMATAAKPAVAMRRALT